MPPSTDTPPGTSTAAPHERPHASMYASTYGGTYGARPQRGGMTPWHLRTSRVERDHVVELLAQFFADGRLDQPEFDRRMQAAMTARTHADLAPLLADLPHNRRPGPAAPPDPSASDRMLGALCHLIALVASFVGPLILLLTVGRDSAFVRDQALESLSFQLTFLLANVALVFGTVVTLGLGALLYVPLIFGWLVLVMIGSVGALDGKAYRYPLNIRLQR